MPDNLPLPAEHLIREAARKLADSRRTFRSKQVADARELLELVLREHGTMAPPPATTARKP